MAPDPVFSPPQCLYPPRLRTRVLAIDAVPRDGQQVAARGHDVAQDGEVPVVDVGSVKLDDGTQLLEELVADGLDAEHLDDLDHVVGDRATRVDAFLAEDA